MGRDTITFFETSTKEWLGQKLLLNDPPIILQELKTILQTNPTTKRYMRNLQDETSSLTVDVEASGTYTRSDSTITQSDINFDSKVESIFTQGGSDYLEKLKFDSYQCGDVNTASFFDSFATIDVMTSVDKDYDAVLSDSESSGLGSNSRTFIVIVASASAGAALLLAFFMYTIVKKKRNSTLKIMEEDADFDPVLTLTNESKPAQNKAWDGMISHNPFADVNVREFDAPMSDSGSGDVGHIHNNQNEVDIDDDDDDDDDDDETKDNTDNVQPKRAIGFIDILNEVESNESGEDNRSLESYGFSVENGIASKDSMDDAISLESDGNESFGPLQMDLYGLGTAQVDFEDDGGVEINLTDLASIISDGSYENGDSFSADEKGLSSKIEMQSLPMGENRREIVAPPGKLGVIVDTTEHGLIIHKVKESSPLENIIFPGDKILEIDGMNARNLSASSFSKIIASRVNKMRKIVVESMPFDDE